MRFVVYGAGAVGGVLGGHLALQKHDVLLVCRRKHADAIEAQRGLRMKSATAEHLASLTARSELEPAHARDVDCVLLTTKSTNTEASVESLAAVAPATTRVVSFQNGVGNEPIIGMRFANVFGGVCRMQCSFLRAGYVSFAFLGRLIVGKWPKGADPFAKQLGAILGAAGFKVAVSRNVIEDKWLKLATNLVNGFYAFIDARDHDAPEFTTLKVGVLEEALAVMHAGGVRARSCDGRDRTLEETIEMLRKPRAKRSSSVRVNNSTWQDLHLRRKKIENGYFHDPIIELGRMHGIETPFNAVSLDFVVRSARAKSGPGAYRASEVLEAVRARQIAV